MPRNSVLIMSGYNNRAVVSFCRFCVSYDVDFHIVALNSNDLINLTAYKDKVIATRTSKVLRIDDFLSYKRMIQVKTEVDNIVVLPSSEFLNRFLLDNVTDLEHNNFIVPLTTNKLYQAISDKYSFCRLCEDHGINIPKEFEQVDMSHIPFVAKPKQYFVNGKVTNEKPILVMNETDFQTFNAQKDSNDFYFQEFVGGDSFYLLYYFDRSGSYSVYSQQNLIQQDHGLSIVGAKSSDFHNSNLSKSYAKLLKDEGFCGLIMIEIKYYNGKDYMIEANPRLWGPSQLILDANMDLFYRFAKDFKLTTKNVDHTCAYKVGETYFWSGGIHMDLVVGNELAFHQYDEDQFFKEYHKWSKNDIYLKKDSISVYFSELKKNE